MTLGKDLGDLKTPRHVRWRAACMGGLLSWAGLGGATILAALLITVTGGGLSLRQVLSPDVAPRIVDCGEGSPAREVARCVEPGSLSFEPILFRDTYALQDLPPSEGPLETTHSPVQGAPFGLFHYQNLAMNASHALVLQEGPSNQPNTPSKAGPGLPISRFSAARVPWEDVTRKGNVKVLHGTTFILDTAMMEYVQFGHIVTKYIQLYTFVRFGKEPVAFGNLLVFRHSLRLFAKYSPHLRRIVDFVHQRALPFVQVVYADDINPVTTSGTLLLPRAYTNYEYESLFSNVEQQQRFRSDFFSHLGWRDPYSQEKCPPPRVLILNRGNEPKTSGTATRPRAFLNYDVFLPVLREFGITSYENVSVSEDSSTEEHLEVFANFGLLISAHSSQLKNIMFAKENSIVLEVKVNKLNAAFEVGVHGLIYEHSEGHDPDPENLACLEWVWGKNCNIVINRQVLADSLRSALAKQRLACGRDIWQSNTPK